MGLMSLTLFVVDSTVVSLKVHGLVCCVNLRTFCPYYFDFLVPVRNSPNKASMYMNAASTLTNDLPAAIMRGSKLYFTDTFSVAVQFTNNSRIELNATTLVQ